MELMGKLKVYYGWVKMVNIKICPIFCVNDNC